MKKFIYLFIYLLNNVIVLFATDTTFVNQTQKEYFIGKKVQYLEDKTNQITFNQLLTEKYINQFKALDKKSFVSSMPNSGAVWFKFILKNNSIEDLKLILSFVKTDVYEADLYFIDKQNLTKHLKTGICLPPEKRAYKSLSPAFPIELLPHETGTFYVRIYSVSFHHLIPNLVEEEHFEEISHNKFAFWGLFYGFILFIFAFNIALYVMFRERKLLYFLGHIFFMILFTSSIDGFLFVYGNILVHWTNGFQSLITTGFFVCFLLLFIKEFLQLRNISKLANRLVNTYAISFLSITVLGLLEQSWGFWLGIFALIPLFFLMLYISYLCYKTNGTANNYLLLVLWIFLILGTLNILSLLSILPLNDITRWNFHLAFGLEILILTSGFIYDLRISQLEYVKKTTEKQSKIKIKNSYLEEKIYQANQNLETKTLQLESILESSPDYIYSFDKDLKLLTANNAALERMKSYGYDFTLGLYFKKIFPKEISDFLEPLLLETLKTEKRISIETRGRKLPNRPSYYYSMTFSPILSKASEVVGVSLFIRDITNPVKIKKRLEENETFLLTIFDSAPDALFLIDQAKFSLERCNSTAMEMFELEEVDMIKAVENGIPLTKEKMQEVYQSIINKKEFITEMRYINRSGRNFWGEIKCSNFIIQKREFLLIRITNIDKRKNAEEHIKYLNRQMKGILENTKDTVFAIDNNYRYIIFNEMHRRRMLYAYKATVKIGDNILDHLKGVPDVDCFKEDTAKALRGEQFLVERNYGEGEIRNHVFETLYNPIKNDENEIIGVAIFAREITEKKRQESIIIQKEANLRAILETNDFAIWMIDLDLKLIDFNESYALFFKKFYGFNVKIGDNFLVTDLKTNFEIETRERIKYILAGNIGIYTDEYILEGKKYIFHLKGFPIRENGKVVGVACFSQNITQIKKNERMLKKKNKALKKVNTELDKFVYSASHDLRAPLSSILGLISLINDDSSEQEKEMYYSLMKKSVKKLDDFIQQIVHYSRNARISVIAEKIDLNELVNYSIENLQYMPNSQKIKTDFEDTCQIDIVTDKFRLGVILNNLISNAFRYADMRKEEPFVKIKASADNLYIKIIVEDNGQGIEEKYLPKIFDMFYRASETNTGSGLGLYILKETLTILKGNIKVKSEYGFGTTFEIIFPNLLNTQKK